MFTRPVFYNDNDPFSLFSKLENSSVPEEDFLAKLTQLPFEKRKSFLRSAFERLVNDNPDMISYPMDQKLFAHILAAHIIGETPLEGMPLYRAADYFVYMLPRLIEKGSLQTKIKIEQIVRDISFVKSLDHALNSIHENPSEESISQLAQCIIDRIATLNPEERLLLPAGFKGFPGHAMLMEVIKLRNGTFTVRFLNSGDGIQYHNQSVDSKLTEQSYLEINDISLENICDSVFWTTFIDIYLNKYQYKGITSEDIYERLIFCLRGHIAKESNEITTITASASGVCAFKIFKIYLYYTLGPDLAFQLIFQMEFWSLVNFFQTHSSQELSSSDRELLTWSMEKLCKEAEKLSCYYDANQCLEKKIFPENALCEDLLKVLALQDVIEEKLNERICVPRAMDLETWLKVIPEKGVFFDPKLDSYIKSLGKKSKVSKTSLKMEGKPLALLKILSPQGLKKWRGYISGLSAEFPTRAFFTLNTLIENMPLPDPAGLCFGKKTRSQNTFLALEQNLSELMLMYVNLAHQIAKLDHRNHSLKIYQNLYHLFALSELAARFSLQAKFRVDIGRYAIRPPLMDLLFNETLFSKMRLKHENKDAYQRFCALKQYFEKRNKGKSLTLFFYPIPDSSFHFEINSESQKTLADFSLIGSLLESSSELKKIFDVQGLSSDVYKLAYLFTSKDLLPKEYLILRNLAFLLKTFDPYCTDSNVEFQYNMNFYFQFQALSQTEQTIPIVLYRTPHPQSTISKITQNDEIRKLYYEFHLLDPKSKRNLVKRFLDFESPLIADLYLKNFSQNEGLCGAAKNLLDQGIGDEYSVQKLIEVFDSDVLKIHYCLSLYQENPELLESFPQALKQVFSEQNLLENAFKDSSNFSNKLELFFTKAINFYAKNLSKAETFFNVAEIALIVDRQIPERQFTKTLGLRKWISIFIEELEATEKRAEKGKEKENSPKIQESEKIALLLARARTLFVKSFEGTKTFNDLNEATQLFTHWLLLAYLKQFPKEQIVAQQVIVSLEEPLSEVFSNHAPLLLNAALKKLGYTSVENWQGAFPSYTNSHSSVDILNGIFWVGNEILGPLPEKFCVLYSQYIEREETALRGRHSKFHAIRDDGLVKMVSKSGIQRVWVKLEDKFYRLFTFDPSIPLNFPQKSHLNYRMLKNFKEGKCWVGFKDGPNLYEVEFIQDGRKKKYGKFAIRNRFGHYLINFQKITGDLPPIVVHLLHFESLKYLRFWTFKKEGSQIPASLELASYQLFFKYENGNLVVREKPGLDGMKLIAPEKPLFENFKSYLVLEASSGQKVVLIPNGNYLFNKGLAEDPLNPLYSVDFEALDKERPFFIYNLSGEKLIARDLEGQILLSLVKTASREYESALSEIRKCWKDTPYNESELGLIQKFTKTFRKKEESLKFSQAQPALYATMINLDALLLQNIEDHEFLEMSEEYFENLILSYVFYLQHLKAIPQSLKLQIDQEFLIIEKIKDRITEKPHKRLIKFRKKVLKGIEVPTIQVAFNFPKPFFTKFEKFLFDPIPEAICPSLLAGETLFRKGPARSDLELPKHFLHLLKGLFSENERTRRETYRDILFMECDKETFPRSKPRFCALQILIFASLQVDFFKQLTCGRSDLEALQLMIKFINANLPGFKNLYQQQFFKKLTDPKPIIFSYSLTQPPLLKSFSSDISPVTVPKKNSCIEILERLKAKCFDNSKIFEIYFHRRPKKEDYFPFPLEIPESSKAYEKVNNSPYAKNFYEALKNSYETNRATPGQILVTGEKEHSLNKAMELLNEKIEGFDKAIRDLIAQIEEELNETPLETDQWISPEDLKKIICEKLLKKAGKIEKITYAQCRYFQMRKELDKLANLNPFLKESVITEIGMKQAIVSWLTIEKRQAAECLALIQKLLKKDLSQNNEEHLLNLLSNQLLFDNDESLILDYPHLLAFQEVTCNYRVNQKDIIIKCLKKNFTHFFFQLMMGAGKTHVILPSLAFLLSDGIDIPVILVPNFIYPQAKHDLKTALELNNGEHVYEFLYSRSDPNKLETLINLVKALSEVKLLKGCLISTPESIQSLILDLIDYSRSPKRESIVQGAERLCIQEFLSKIVLELQTHGLGIGEEAHILFQCLKEMNFTIGKSRPLKTKQWLLTMEIYRILANSFSDFLNSGLGRSFQKNGPNWDKVKERLIFELVDNIFVFSEEESTLKDLTVKYLSGVYQNSQFLRNIAEKNPTLANDIARAKEQLNSFLPHSLSKALKVNFGPKERLPYAVPYTGNNVPSQNAEFGHLYILQNFTIQMYLELGLSFDQFKNWLCELQKLWMKEMHVSDSPLSNKVKLFLEILAEKCPMETLNFGDENHLLELYVFYRKHPKIIFDFLENWVMPEIKRQPKILNSNAQDVGDLALNKVIAWSGTPYNLITGPEQFSKNSLVETKETGQLLRVLARPENQKVHILETFDLETFFDFIQNFAQQNPNFFVLNDLGALLRGVKNLEVAKRLLSVLPERIKGVVCFDDHSLQECIVLRDGEILPFYRDSMPENSRFTYLDQLHAFGSDIPQAMDALQLVTHNKETMFFETLQANKRMRQLEYGQRVNHLILKELMEEIKDLCLVPGEIQAGHLMIFEFINENTQLEREILISSMHKIRHVLRKKLFNSLILLPRSSWEADHQEHVTAFLKSFFIQEQKDRPLEQFGSFEQLVSPSRLLKSYFKDLQRNFKESFSEAEINQVKELIQKAASRLPNLVSSKLFADNVKEIQKQEEKSLLKETLILQGNQDSFFKEYTWTLKALFDEKLFKPLPIEMLDIERKNLNIPRIFSLNDWLVSVGSEPIFDKNLLVTENFLRAFKNETATLELPIKSVSYYLNVIGENGFYTLLLSIKEANYAQKFMREHSEKQQTGNILHMALKDLAGDTFGELGSIDSEMEEKVQNYAQFIRAQLICFDGKEYFPPHLEPVLESWLEPFDSEKMLDTFNQFHRNRRKQDQGFSTGNLFNFLSRKRKAGSLKNFSQNKKARVEVRAEKSEKKKDPEKVEKFK